MKRITCISGTPGTGKSTIGLEMAKAGFPVVEVEAHARARGTYSYIENGETLVIDIDELADSFRHYLKSHSELFVVGHLSHNLDEANAVVVLRTHPDKLRARLEDKGWSKAKIEENVEAEALGVCLGEALDLHGRKVSELDTTDAPIGETARKVLSVHIEGKRFRPQTRDWLLEYILKSAGPYKA